MSKFVYTGLMLMACSSSALAADYYTCATSGQLTTNPNGVTGCAVTTVGTWNTASNRLFVRAGTTYTINGTVTFVAPFDVSGSVILGSANNLSRTFSANVTVRNGGSIATSIHNNLPITIGAAATLLIEQGGTFTNNGGGGSSALVVNGSIVGDGNLATNAAVAFSGTGTINGATPTAVDALASPVDLKTVGPTWNGTAWSPAAPSSVNHRAICAGDFQKSLHGNFTAGRLTVNAGVTVTFDNDDELNAYTSVLNNGTIVFEDDTTVGTGLNLTGTGSLVLRRTVNLPSNQFIRIGFPVTTGPVYSELAFNNFTQRPTYRWNASNSTWTTVAAGASLNATAFALYGTAGSNRSLSLPISHAELNNAAMTFTLGWHDPGAVSGFVNSVTDGWNQLSNPFMDFLDADAVVAAMALTTNFASNAISVWDGSNYMVRSTGGGGDAEAEYLQPFEAFFVRTLSSHSGSFQITNAMRAATRPVGGSYVEFKTAAKDNDKDKAFARAGAVVENIKLSLTASVDGKNVRTYVAQNPAATASFDGGPEVPFQFPLATMPYLYSVDQDGLALRMNHFGTVHKRAITIGFDYYQPATITLNADLVAMPRNVHAELYDRVTGETVRIDKESYTFEHRGDEPNERFELRFLGNTRNY